MRGTQLEHELMLFSEIDLLHVLALGEVPEMQAVAVFAAEQNFRDETVLERIGRAPFACHHGVVAEMPPTVIAELLRAALDLPSAERLEGFVVHQEDSARRLAFRISQRRDIDAAGAAMGRVRTRVAGLFCDLLGLDHLDYLRSARFGFGVDDIDA